MRIDKFLKVSRLIKRRTVANEVADAGRISVNGKEVKLRACVKCGAIIEATPKKAAKKETAKKAPATKNTSTRKTKKAEAPADAE